MRSNRFMDRDVIRVACKVLLDSIKPKNLNQEMHESAGQNREQSRCQLAPLFHARGGFNLSIIVF